MARSITGKSREFLLRVHVDSALWSTVVEKYINGTDTSERQRQRIIDHLYSKRFDAATRDTIEITWPVEWYEIIRGQVVEDGDILRAED